MSSRREHKDLQKALEEAQTTAETVKLMVEYLAELSEVVQALSELAGPKLVQHRVCFDREVAMKKKVEDGLQAGRLRFVEQSTTRSLLCGRTISDQPDILPTYQQFQVANSPSEVTHLFVGVKAGDKVEIGMGQRFEVERVLEEAPDLTIAR